MKDNVIVIINDYNFLWHPPTLTPQDPIYFMHMNLFKCQFPMREKEVLNTHIL